MYAETGLMFPYFHNFSQQVQHFDDFCCSNKPYASSGLVQTFTISDYSLGGEGDLFKAPEPPVIGEPITGLDSMASVMSMISCGEDAISTESLTMSDVESSIECGQLLSEVFCECRKDLLAKEENETPLSEVLNIKIPNVKTDESFITDEKLLDDGVYEKCMSSNCLRPMDSVPEAALRPRFLDFLVLDFEAFNGMRRAFSEGDIKTLGNGDSTFIQPSEEQPRFTSSCTSDVRREKLSRYWSKKSKRNFGRKIKYACRKALADSQPRIRGRFAKTEEMESPKMQ